MGGNLLQRTRCTYFYDNDGSHCNKRTAGQGCDALEGFNRIHASLGASPSCVATHPSDMCVALAALGAVVHLRGASGKRTLSLTELHRLPEDHPEREPAPEPGELITAVELPALPFAGRSTYRKVRDRASYAFALVSVAAERLGLPMDRVTVACGDSSLPGVILAGGSQQTASIGSAVLAAYQELVGELLKLAAKDSPLAGLKPEEVGSRNGGLYKLDEPERHESYAVLLGRAGRDELAVEGSAPMPFELMHWSMHSYGAQFCEVRVNAITGETRVSRFLGSFDCGRILNAKTAASQFRGGIIMGLGLALTEETQFDERNGRIMNPSLAEYHMPVHMDVPEIDVICTDIADPHAPMGAHGVGEVGITGVGAAVANAVYNATGKRVRDLPITLDKLL